MHLSLSRTALLVSLTLAAAAPVAGSESATAAPADPLVVLDDYLVETNPATFRLKAPSVTHQLLGSDLRALNLPETAVALNHLPNLFIRQRYTGDKNALVSIRGTSNRQPGRTLVLADGMLLSNFLGTGFGNSPRWFLVAPEEIEKIAVSYGPYSALYAGNSIGGTVLFTTSMPSGPVASLKTQFMVQDFSEYGTEGTFAGHTAYLALGDRVKRFSWFVLYSAVDNDSQPQSFRTINRAATSASVAGAVPVSGVFADLDPSGVERFVFGAQSPSAARHDLVKLKLGLDLTDDLHVRYTLAHWANSERDLDPATYLRDAAGAPVWSGRVDVGGAAFTIPGNAFPLSERRQADLVNALVVAYEPARGLHATFSGSLYDVLRDRTRASTVSVPAARTGGAGQATIVGRTGWRNFDAKLGWRGADGALARHAIAAGWNFTEFFTAQDQWAVTDWRDDATRTSLLNGTGGTTRTHALYLQDVWTLAARWTLTPGLRWESWRASDGFRARDFAGAPRVTVTYPERAASAFSPKLALAWKPDTFWNVRLSLADARRFPTVGELFQGGVSASGSITQNDPDLRPERDLAKDLTVERSFPQGVVRVSLFEEDVRDALVNQSTLRPDGTSFSGVQNVARVRTRGAELALDRRGLFGGALDLSASASFTDAVILENPGLPGSIGSTFPRIPREQFKAMATWRVSRALDLGAAVRWSGRQFNTLDNSDPLGGYGGVDRFLVADAKLAWRLRDDVTASLGVNNLFDDRYHVFHPLPGRTWFFELAWRR